MILRTAAILALGLVLFGCSPEWHESRSYPSPDGKYVIVVTTELQGANDPEPWWQHISLYRAGEETKNPKGNLYIYSSKTPPTVQWTGPKALQIEIPDVSYTFTGPIASPLSREIKITTIVK